ncbi:BtpA/SgcQ family protein [Saliphagus sp. GCM10025334]
MDWNHRDAFGTDRPILGMIHLPALPGSPGYEGSREAIRTRALEDAAMLEAGGVDGIVVENFGDSPFYPDEVPNHIVAEMSALATTITSAVDVPVGVNVLRNDAEAALSVAAAAGASFVRVNVHVGAATTDQGIVEGRAHETLRLRDRLEADVAILADVDVKHATPLGEAGLAQTALETAVRGRADGLIVSGAGTGQTTSLEDLERVVEAVSTVDREVAVPVPVFVGSGVTPESLDDAFAVGADGAIVGTALKEGGETTNPVSRERVEALVEAARTAES